MSLSAHFSDLAPHLKAEIQAHFHQNCIIFGTPFPPHPPPPPIFHPFPRLPLELQTYIWKLVFLHNTTYNSVRHRVAISTFTQANTLPPNNACSIYASPNPNPLYPADPDRAIEIAEGKTAFWAETWVFDPRRGNRDDRHIHLVEPAEQLTRITLVSGIPVLLHTCYLARRTALETLREVLVQYQVPGFRTPWPHMVRALDHALQQLHLSTFHLFPRLPINLQKYIWKLAFLRNTTYNTTRCHQALSKFGTTTETSYTGNNYSTIYSRIPSQAHPTHWNAYYKSRHAEVATAFWTYSSEHPSLPHNPPREDCYIMLPYTEEDHISGGEAVVAFQLETAGGIVITRESKIPNLLHACRLSRQTTLEVWRDVLSGYRLPSERIPWPNMLAAIAYALHRHHHHIQPQAQVSLKRKSDNISTSNSEAKLGKL